LYAAPIEQISNHFLGDLERLAMVDSDDKDKVLYLLPSVVFLLDGVLIRLKFLKANSHFQFPSC